MRVRRKASRPRSESSNGTTWLLCLVICLLTVAVSLNMLVILTLVYGDEKGESKVLSPLSSFHSHLASALVRKHNLKAAAIRDETNDEGQQNHMDNGFKHILEIFQEAGVILTSDQIEALPTWSQVQEVVGTHPRILNLESCARYRESVPPSDRMLGSAGPFNSGTNLLAELLIHNCKIHERKLKCGPQHNMKKECFGMLWQVPWGKHTPARFRDTNIVQHYKNGNINKDHVLPVVAMRNPYSWFHSMCKNGYAAHWEHGRGDRGCPNLKDSNLPGRPWNPVHVFYGEGREDHHASLAHMWNDWYGYYLNDDADHPYLVVRMEDLVFYPKETTRQVCDCVGGKIQTDEPFKYIVASAKAKGGPMHDKTTGLYQAWIKHARPPAALGDFSEADFLDAREALNQTLMTMMGYRHPEARG